MFKLLFKTTFFIVFFSIIGFCVSSGLSYLENNIPFESYILYISNKNKDYIHDNLINDSIITTDELEDNEGDEVVDYGIPTSIYIESVQINLEIREGEYNYETQTWSLSNGYAYWANLSDSIKGKDSNTVIYAHNQLNEFYKTKDLNIGDTISIKTDKGNNLTFRYVEDRIVYPDESEVIFQKNEKPVLTLITCNGIFSEKRRIMYAEMIIDSKEEEEIKYNFSSYIDFINNGKDFSKISSISRLYSSN